MSGWRAVFGHAEPYPNQAEGIELVLDTARDGGFVALEGACGTGKTMLSLTAGIHAIRDPALPFDRLFVVTSVKQQLRQFEDDIERIGRSLAGEAPTSMTLVGKADVCPYHLTGTGGMTSSGLYERCENLRERTRELVAGGRAAEALAGAAVVDDGLRVGDEVAPYPGAMPTTGGPSGETEYCPFYAQYLADAGPETAGAEAVPIDPTEHLRPEALVDGGVRAGSCPHSLMGALIEEAEVVVGNYYHAFDPRTVAAFTGPLVDDRTLFVCDEAHMLEERVRELASSSVALTTLERSRDELATVIEVAKGRRGDDARSVARGALEEAGIDRTELSVVHGFLGAVLHAVEAILEGEGNTSAGTVPLRDPETVAVDALTERVLEAGYGRGTWLEAERVAPVVEYVLNAVDGEERWRATPTAGRFLAEWIERDHEAYFRTVALEARERAVEADGWRATLRARLQLHNCVPADHIASVLERFGGGVLMSATLAPMEDFVAVSGLERLEAAGRPVVTRRFGLPFPERNRLSLVVDAPKFTYRNRGAPGEETPTRSVYAEAIAGVARSPGNVLVGMPSYAEARWAAAALEDRLDREVLLDRPSDRSETDALKAHFFAGDPKVLVTSLRGTLTEGVDYAGDRLAAAAIVGVPIVNTSDPVTRATQTAYEERLGDGFDRALVVPAVRKARQALGRVIRGPEEVGVRALIDERYGRSRWDGVRGHLPDAAEFDRVDPTDVEARVRSFWSEHGA
ncbi:MAG: ATP-dependent DNA helicase [Halobacteriota archaeon]